MAEEQKTTITVKNLLNEGKSVLTDEGEYEIADKLNWYKFTTGKEYNVTIQDNTIVYARLSEEQASKDKEKKKSSQNNSHPINTNNQYEDRQHSIIAQSTLKEAVNLAIAKYRDDVDIWNVEEIHRKLYKYMINKEYEKDDSKDSND